MSSLVIEVHAHVSVKVFIALSFGNKEHVGDESESGCI